MENMPSVSIIIPVLNGEKTIRACLESVFACKTIDYEVLVVNDGSTDNTLNIIKDYPCKIIDLGQNMGRSYARNTGIEKSSSSTLLFTDSDCIVCKNWQETALDLFKRKRQDDERLAAMEGRILPIKGFINKCDAYAGYGYNQNLKENYHQHFCTANLIADKESLLKAGAFNNNIRDIEDQDLGFRLLEKGCTLFYQPAFSVVHNHTRNSFSDFLSHYYTWGKSLGNYFDIRYNSFRKTFFSPYMNNILIYALLIPVFSFLITAKITLNNISYDPAVVLVFPFVFFSKIAYRIGALSFIKNKRICKLIPDHKER